MNRNNTKNKKIRLNLYFLKDQKSSSVSTLKIMVKYMMC